MRIAGTGSATPKKVVTNETLSEFLEASGEWIPSRTGIRERRVLSDEKFEALAAEAAGKALADAGISDGAVDLILCSTATSPYITPSLDSALREGLKTHCSSPVEEMRLGPVLGIHLGDSAIGVAWLEKETKE